MILSYSQIIKPRDKSEKDTLIDLCYISKCLYNYSLYQQRLYFRETRKYLSKQELYELVRDNNPKLYKKVNSWVGQRAIFQVDNDYQSFFNLMKVDPEKAEQPYYKKNGLIPVVFGGSTFQISGGVIRLSLSKYLRNRHGSKFLEIYLPSFVADKLISEVTILPIGYSKFEVKLTYEVEEAEPIKSGKVLAIDPGLQNLAACVSTDGEAFLISGRWIKSQNQWYNKQISELQAEIDKETNKIKKMKLIQKKRLITRKRNRRVKDELHKAAYNIVKYCEENDIGTIIIGKNIGWKNEINIGKRNNQNFVQMPIAKLIEYITYKAKIKGITVEVQEESHTSKTDSLALEPVCHHDKYLGKRTKRGLFKSSTGKTINADINGSINILRKSMGDSRVSEIVSRGRVFRPGKLVIRRDSPRYRSESKLLP
jgi:IS605 OrfB family transposase